MATFNVEIANSFINIKPYKEYKVKAIHIAELIEKCVPHLNSMFNLKNHLININVKPIRADNLDACYYHHYQGLKRHGSQLQIDPRKHDDDHSVLAALCHEMVHAEQYDTGKIKVVNGEWCWNGSKIVNDLSDLETYMELPQEAEAYGRQEKLAKILKRKIK